jgi:hypothetical protein
MRRGLYFVLMLVLVLRGLTGTAMAAGVLPPLLPAATSHPQEHVHHRAAGGDPVGTAGQERHQGLPAGEAADSQHPAHAPVHGMLAAAPAGCDGTSAGCAAHEHHSAACSACEICHSAMLDAPTAPAPDHPPTGATLPVASAQFDSAPAALAIKPPIA